MQKNVRNKVKPSFTARWLQLVAFWCIQPSDWLACWPMSLCLSYIYLIFPWLNGVLYVLFYTLFPSIVSSEHNILILISFIYMQCAIFYYTDLSSFMGCGFPGGSDGKASARNVGDSGLIPGSERSPGEGNGNPLQYSCLENPMDGGAW